ncbi:MAG: site-2 protease family protein [Candidatus Micrarchaeota archaeon]|nr:site-2 protease family protein [Candidatus Micrarchaeota archaeon]
MVRKQKVTAKNISLNTDIDYGKAALIGIAGLVLLILLYFSYIPGIWKIFLGIALMAVVGELFVVVCRFNRMISGMTMLSTKRGIDWIDGVSQRYGWLWIELADWGLVTSFGVLSYFIFKRKIRLHTMVLGIATIAVFLFFVLPYLSLALNFINIPNVTSRIQIQANPTFGVDIGFNIQTLLYSVIMVVGFASFILILLLYGAGLILYQIVFTLLSLLTPNPNYTQINQSVPGVAPVLPGITIPFFAGLLSLGLLLAVHELSHGVLARVFKVKLKSLGMILFGIIPFGAFVEPDEKQVEKLGSMEQNRIFIAGIASNLVLCFIFFVLTYLMFTYVVPNIITTSVSVQSTIPGSSASEFLQPGETILQWNGHPVHSIADFRTAAAGDTPYSNVSVTIANGTYVMKANATGKVGVSIQQQEVPMQGAGPAIDYFLYTFFALSFLLNFFVALVNLLPLPMFDGWRTFAVNIKNRRITFAFGALIIVAFFVNILPWAWILPLIGIPFVIISLLLVGMAIRWMWGWSNSKS